MLIIAMFQNYWNSLGLPHNFVPTPLVCSIFLNIVISIRAECVSVKICLYELRLSRHLWYRLVRTGLIKSYVARAALM